MNKKGKTALPFSFIVIFINMFRLYPSYHRYISAAPGNKTLPDNIHRKIDKDEN